MDVKCPILVLIGAMVCSGCEGELLPAGSTLSAGTQQPPRLAADSGVPRTLPTQSAAGASGYTSMLTAGAAVPVRTMAGTAGEGSSHVTQGGAGQASANASAGRSSSSRWHVGAAGANASQAGGAGVASSAAPDAGAADASAADGGGSRGVDDKATSAGAASAGSGGAGCVVNLACQLSAPPSTGDAHQDCVDRINQFRERCACLSPLERWVEGEDCADEMAKYDSGGTEAHAAFGDGICDGGSAQNECPGWHSEAQVVGVCLQKMWDEGPPPVTDCSGSCFQKYGHFLNMTNQRLTKVACGFYETPEGQFWSVQNFAR